MRSFAQVTAVVTVLVGGLVLLGWVFDIAALKSVMLGLTTMKANTALGFVLAGLALWLYLRESGARWARYAAGALAGSITILAILTLCEYLFGWQLGIDQMLFKDLTSAGDNLMPGRMAPISMLNFLFLGAALLLLGWDTTLGDRLAQVLSLLIALLSGVAWLGYAFGATELYGLGTYSQIAAHTALTFLIVSAGLICAHPERGLITIITGENAGSFMARRLLPAAIILPMLLGWVGWQGQRAGLYDTALGLALIVSSSIVIFVGMIWWNARMLNRTDTELKLALTTDLRQSEERLRYVVWATMDAVWDRSIPSGEIWWNEGLQKLFHYQADEVESSVAWWEEHIHPEDRARVVRSIQDIIETRQALWSREYRFACADGSYANVFDRGYILYDEQTGEPQRMLGAMADITEQKNIEKALRQSEELFAKAFSATPAGITLTRLADGRVIEVNDAYVKMLGYSRREMLSQTEVELGVVVEDQARLMRTINDQGAVRNVEVRVWTKSGQLKTVLSSMERVEVGGVACVLSVIYDITERKLAEAAHQQSETMFRALFELSPDSVLLIDPHDEEVSWPIIDCNAAACLMNGYTREELIGQSIDVLNGRQAPADERTVYLEMLRERGNLKAEFQHRHKNGGVFPIETSTTLIKVGERELIIGIDRDITQRKRANEALRDVNEKLAHGLAELKERNRESALLNELGNLLQSCPNAEAAYKVISESAGQLFPQAQGVLSIINAAHDLVEPVAAWNSRLEDERAFAPKDCWALRERQPHLVDKSYQNLPCPHVVGSPAALLCIPMVAQGEVLGVFQLRYPASRSQPQDKGSADLPQGEQRLALTVADTISLAVTNLRLRETLRNQSIRDPLTGLYNRRFMEESLERELHRAARKQLSVGIIMLDLDNFKDFNDTFGHEAGDTLLHELGNFVIKHIRAGDIACRYGGEEFLLILPEASLEATRQRAQKLNEGIRNIRVKYRGKRLKAVTVSLGVAIFPEHGRLRADVVRAADTALYRAKHEGRDRVAVADLV
jgi:diguanylate cyclase (GGDEF)-like protein/PAS domain S-box-containing protein